jgi:hypothetical protein
MVAILRSIAAVILGVVLGLIVIVAFEIVGQVVYPYPVDIDPKDQEALKAAFANAPPLALLPVLLGWIVGTFSAAALAALIAQRAPVVHGVIIGILFMLATVLNLTLLPHPLWFWASLVVFLPAGYFGAKCAVSRNAAT